MTYFENGKIDNNIIFLSIHNDRLKHISKIKKIGIKTEDLL